MKSFWPAKFSKQDKNDIPGGWPNEAVQIEEMVEELRKVSGDLNKRISTYIPSQGVPDPDKRLKKIPEFNIVTAFTQSANRFEGCKPELGCVFDSIGKASNELAICRRDLEKDLEESVITHLKKLVDDEIPTIQKDRKHLSKYCNELKTANERLRSSDNTIQTANSSSSNTQAAIAKHQQFRAAQEEAEQRAYQQKDHTLKAFFQFDSRTRENASKMLEYLELHARYHQECASILQTWIPQIKSQIVEHLVSPVFRTPMIIHLNETNREISYVLDICIKALNKEDALKEEGIFRTAGSKTKVDTLTHALDAMRANSLIFECEYSVVADALKQYFRFMEEPLLMSSLYDEWMNAMQMQSHNDRLQSLWTVCHKLPKGNMDNLRYLIKFLAKVSTYSEHNKMTPSNLGIVFGPNLLKSGKLNDTDPIGMMSTGVQSQIVEIMINHADWFFPGDSSSINSVDGQPPDPSLAKPLQPVFHSYIQPVSPDANHNLSAAPTLCVTSKVRLKQQRHSDDKRKKEKEKGKKGRREEEVKMRKEGEEGRRARKEVEEEAKVIRKKDDVEVAKTKKEEEDEVKMRNDVQSRQRRINQQQHHAQVQQKFAPACPPDTRCPPPTLPRPSPAVIQAAVSAANGTGVCVAPEEDEDEDALSQTSVSWDGVETPRPSRRSGRPVCRRSSLLSDTGAAQSGHRRTASPVSIASSAPPPARRNSDSSSARVPPPQPTSYAAKSFHADVYDTLFALQSLSANGVGDYLSRVRSVYEGRTLLKHHQWPSSSQHHSPTRAGSSSTSTDGSRLMSTSFSSTVPRRRPPEMFTAFSEDLSPKNETPSRTFVVSSSAGAYVNPVTNAAAIDAAAAMPNNHSADIDGDKLSVERPSTPKPSRHSPVSASFSPGGSLPRKPQRKNPAPQPPGSRPLAATSSSDEGNYTKSMPSVLHVAPAPSSMSTNSSNHQTISVNTDSGTAQMKNRPSSIRARPLKSSTLPPPRPTSMPPEPLSESRPSRPPRPSHAPPAIPRSSLPSGEALAESDMRKGSLESEDPYDDLDSPTEPENTYL